MPKLCPIMAAGVMLQARQIMAEAKTVSSRSGRDVPPDLTEHKKAMRCVEGKCAMWDVLDGQCGLAYQKTVNEPPA